MILALLLSVLASSSAVDYWISLRRIRKFGTGVESNPFILWLLTRLSPAAALVVGSILPTLACAFAAGYASPLVLALYVGVRLDRAMLQLESRELESKLEGYQVRLLPALRASVPKSVK